MSPVNLYSFIYESNVASIYVKNKYIPSLSSAYQTIYTRSCIVIITEERHQGIHLHLIIAISNVSSNTLLYNNSSSLTTITIIFLFFDNIKLNLYVSVENR